VEHDLLPNIDRYFPDHAGDMSGRQMVADNGCSCINDVVTNPRSSTGGGKTRARRRCNLQWIIGNKASRRSTRRC